MNDLTLDIVTDPLPTEPGEKPTSVAMLTLLRRHYLPDESRPAGVFAPEIQAPGPVGRRADLIWLGCTAAAGSHLVGHEVKVSRADVLNELADLTKSDPWQRYCDRWWLVVPNLSLITGLELPESWGVMLPPSGRRTRSMTVHRPAPVLRPVEQGPALKTLAAWQHWKLRDARNHAKDRDRRLERAESELHQLQITAHAADTRPNPTRDFVNRIVKELGVSSNGENVSRWPDGSVNVDDVVVALRDLQTVRGRCDEATWLLTQAKNQLAHSHAVLARAVKDFGSGGRDG